MPQVRVVIEAVRGATDGRGAGVMLDCTHYFGPADAGKAIRTVAGEFGSDVIHVSLLPGQDSVQL